ncbi:hypothetical protein M2322_004332 [Rhodoblastus acidophilus]|uniref:hypothetical protein n=1 Tax=Rhodoblastus acidophilus TaxID=1074 RepID=UPI002224C520|nr:hypothetical protein [Rhodoblastus acidophilus]MCW2318763.1 hypothetical protein [Rhodoblastus acidophilus]
MDVRFRAMTATVLLAALTIATSARAQNAQVDSSYTDVSGWLLDKGRPLPASAAAPATTGANVSGIAQVGQDNRASVVVAGFANVTTQQQDGARDVSTLTISGDGNRLSTTQIGSNDSVTLNVHGQGNAIVQTQTGNNLSYSLTQVGSGKTISVQQIGTK